jgi:hypothetical protein
MCGLSAVTSMSEPCSFCSMTARLGSSPCHAVLVEALGAVGQQAHGLQQVVGHDRLEHVELEVALRAREPDGGVVAEDLHAHHGGASHCVGFTLPGMMELPGSFSGMVSSPMPQRGPLASQRTSLAIFMSARPACLSAPLVPT